LISVWKKDLLDQEKTKHQFLRRTLAALPVASGLITGVITTFQHKEKWAQAKWSSAEIVKQIFLFRTEVGPYNSQSIEERRRAGAITMSAGQRKKEARDHLRHQINRLHAKVMPALKDQQRVAPVPPVHELPAKVLRSLYGRSQVESGACCCPGRNKRTSQNKHVESEPVDGRVPLLHAATSKSLQGLGISTTEDDYTDKDDDYLSQMSAEMYFDSRVLPLMAKLGRESPRLSCRYNWLTVALLLCSFTASILGAFHHSKWIPVALGVAAMLTAIMYLHAANTRLAATNAALAGLRSLEMQFRSSSSMLRRTPAFKQALILRTEQLELGATMAWVGTSIKLRADGEEVEDAGKVAAQDSEKKDQAKGTPGSAATEASMHNSHGSELLF